MCMNPYMRSTCSPLACNTANSNTANSNQRELHHGLEERLLQEKTSWEGIELAYMKELEMTVLVLLIPFVYTNTRANKRSDGLKKGIVCSFPFPKPIPPRECRPAKTPGPMRAKWNAYHDFFSLLFAAHSRFIHLANDLVLWIRLNYYFQQLHRMGM